MKRVIFGDRLGNVHLYLALYEDEPEAAQSVIRHYADLNGKEVEEIEAEIEWGPYVHNAPPTVPPVIGFVGVDETGKEIIEKVALLYHEGK